MAKNRNIGGIYAELSLKDIKFRKGLQNATKQLKGFAVSAAKAGTMAIGAGIAAAGVGIAAGIEKAISEAANLQTLETAFEPLLGSAAAAEDRIRELADFAAKTPFELPEIAKASKVLETLTRGALSTGKGLELVGDAASVAGEPFDEIAVHIGRLYDGLQNGRPVGESMARLQELALITSETRAEIELLQKQSAKGEKVWSLAAKDLARFSGAMEMQSKTWNGKISTLRDNINMTFAAMGQPIIDTLGPLLDNYANKDFTDLGTRLGNAISDALWMLQDGTIWEVFRLGGERALLALRQSDAMGGLIALMATGFDFARGEGDLNPMDTLNRNINAVLDMNEDDLKRIDKQIETLLDQARKNREAAIEASEKPVTYGPAIPPGFFEKAVFGPALPDGFFDQPKTKASIFDEAISSSLDATMQSVNSMQARGLAQGAIYTKSADDKKIGLIESINRILIQASKDSTLRI